jgi:hypothetical protein
MRPIEPRRKIREWTQWEDQRLLAGIYRYGLGNWRSIADFVGNDRTRAQCCQRWCRGLDPNIVKGNWTRETDEQLLALVALHGNKCWTQIAAELGNRCDVQCRYRYHQLAKSPNFEERMAFAREKTAGMPHTKRPRKRPVRAFAATRRTQRQAADLVQMAPQQRNNHERLRLPPIEEMARIIGIKPRRIMEIS